MCQITTPIPGTTFAFWPPNLGWLFLGATVLACLTNLQSLRSSQLPWVSSMKPASVWRFALASCLACLFAASYLAFVASPTTLAQGAWQAHEEAVLPPLCVPTTVVPMVIAADKAAGPGFLLFMFIPFAAGVLFYIVAARRRGLHFRWW
jgi:hypothetical protein